MRLTLLGWIAISCLVIGLIIIFLAQTFIEFTVMGKVWFVLGISAWGIVCMFLTVWSFFRCKK